MLFCHSFLFRLALYRECSLQCRLILHLKAHRLDASVLRPNDWKIPWVVRKGDRDGKTAFIAQRHQCGRDRVSQNTPHLFTVVQRMHRPDHDSTLFPYNIHTVCYDPLRFIRIMRPDVMCAAATDKCFAFQNAPCSAWPAHPEKAAFLRCSGLCHFLQLPAVVKEVRAIVLGILLCHTREKG